MDDVDDKKLESLKLWPNFDINDVRCNPFLRLQFRLYGFVGEKLARSRYTLIEEYVFACLVRTESPDNIIAYHISKEYNTNKSSSYVAGRFIFRYSSAAQKLKLAEEPSKAYVNPDFNLELYYLQTRPEHRKGQ